MQRVSAGLYLGFLLLVLAVQTGLMSLKGILLIDQHEGDALHLIQIILRMAEGQRPHLDFMTPVGVFAMLPMSWPASLGLGLGMSIMMGMSLFALILLPAIWWVGWSRLQGLVAYLFGGFMIILCTALVYGGATQAASIAMYYNRWAWAVAFLLVLIAVLPGDTRRNWPDGLILGLGMAFLALAKVTFFVAFLPGILVALLITRRLPTLLIGVLAGLVVAGLVTLAYGVGFWAAYLGDLDFVASSGLRDAPSAPLISLLIGPEYLVANFVLLAGVVLVRQAGPGPAGIVVLLFAPAFVYATYQNWGNDPKWLILLAILLVQLRPDRPVNNAFGWDVGRQMSLVALVSVALIFPSLLNLTFANLRHAKLDRSAFFQVLPGQKNDDIAMKTDRMYAPVRRETFELRDPEIAALVDTVPGRQVDEVMGQKLWLCKLHMGLVSVLHQMARDLDRVEGVAGKTVFVADTFSNLWLFGSTRPLPGGAPWYYGDKAGMAQADFILVPLCPVTPAARRAVLERLKTRAGHPLREVTQNGLFILYRQSPD